MDLTQTANTANGLEPAHPEGVASAGLRQASVDEAGAEPRAMRVLCPYCGAVQRGGEQCARCRGLFEPLSRQATQNMMGPWQIRDEANPFLPGISLERVRELVARGKVQRGSVVRGPTTRQFWSLACNTPGIAVLLGECHNCHAAVARDGFMCAACGAALTAPADRQHLGLGPLKLLPGEAPAHEVASVGMSRVSDRPASPPPPMSHQSRGAPIAVGVATAGPAIFGPAGLGPNSAAVPARSSRRRGAQRDRAALPALVVVGVTIAAGLVAISARSTPVDTFIRALVGGRVTSTPAPAAPQVTTP